MPARWEQGEKSPGPLGVLSVWSWAHHSPISSAPGVGGFFSASPPTHTHMDTLSFPLPLGLLSVYSSLSILSALPLHCLVVHPSIRALTHGAKVYGHLR